MKKKTWSMICALALCLGLLSAPAGAFTFTQLEPEDVFSPELIEAEKVSDWAKSEIDAAQQAGLVTEHTQSYMTHSATRFQFAELAVNLAEKATGKTIAAAPESTFADCKEIAVLKAYAAGIVSGVGDGKFDPEANTNREQIAAMIVRTIDYIDRETGSDLAPAAADISAFSDREQVSAWAVDAVGTLAANGIMSGTSATTLSPKDSCTVEQCILLLYRVYQQFQTAN